MPYLLGIEVANDEESVKLRQSSPVGYIPKDEEALLEFGILVRKNNTVTGNSNLSLNPNQIRDFLNWVVGDRKPPLPDLVRKFLCLKRARIVNSEASTGTSKALRTKENFMINEIDTILSDDGVTNPEEQDKCLSQNAGKYDAAGGAAAALANSKKPAKVLKGAEGVTGPTGPTGPKGNSIPLQKTNGPVGVEEKPTGQTTSKNSGCTTIVNCDSSAVMVELKDLKETVKSIVEHLDIVIATKPTTPPPAPPTPPNPSLSQHSVTSDVEHLKTSSTDFSAIFQRLNEMESKLRELIESSTIVQQSDKAATAAINADHSELKKLLEEILAILKGDKTPTKPELSVVEEKLNGVKESTENPEILRLLKEIQVHVKQINGSDPDNSILEIVKNLKLQLGEVKDSVSSNPARIIEIINTILPGVKEGIDKLDLQFEAVLGGIRDIRSNISILREEIPDDRTDEILEAIRASQALVDYGPQLTHIDNSIKTMYNAIQIIVAEDYSRRFDELNRKVDDLMDLMRKCCGEEKKRFALPDQKEEQEQEPEPEPYKLPDGPTPPLLIEDDDDDDDDSNQLMIENQPPKPRKRLIISNNGNQEPQPKQRDEKSSRRLFGGPKPVEKQKTTFKNASGLEPAKQPKKRLIILNNGNQEPEPKPRDEQSSRRLFGGPKTIKKEPTQLKNASGLEPLPEEEEKEEKPKRKTLESNNTQNYEPKPRLLKKNEQSSRKVFDLPGRVRKEPTYFEDEAYETANSGNTGTINEEPPAPPNNEEPPAPPNNEEPPAPPNNEEPPAPPFNNQTDKKPEVNVVEKKRDIEKGLIDAVSLEKTLGKGLDKKEKLKLIRELEDIYKIGDESNNNETVDYNEVKKKIDEFLEDFDEKGSLKTALSGYSTKLSKDTWLIYLGNILNSLERMGKPPKKKTSIRGMKYAKSPKKKRNSGRYTRKTRR